MQHMLRLAVFAVAVAAVTALAAGVHEAAPVVFWGTSEEIATIAHGRTTMLVAAAVTLAAAAAIAALGARRPAALVATAALVPVALMLAAPETVFGLLALPPALAVGFYGALAGCTPRGEVARRGTSMLLGVLTLVAVSAGGIAWGIVSGAAFAFIAYGHARAARRPPGAAVASLVPSAAFAVLAALSVLTGGVLAA